MQAQKYPEAIQLMEKARANGTLKSETDYVNLSKLYLIQAQSVDNSVPDATKSGQVLDEGMSKGIVKPSSDNYMLQGEAAELAGNNSKALDAYNKAMPTAKDGEAAVNAGRLLLEDNKYSQAKSLLQQGIDKGVKSKGTAYTLMAKAELGLKNKAGAIADMKLAAQQPDTAEKAQAWLKSNGGQK
jgi:tetratricopeptide (TPR) repeat protein